MLPESVVTVRRSAADPGRFGFPGSAARCYLEPSGFPFTLARPR